MRTRTIAVLELALILPAMLFLAAVAAPALLSQPAPALQSFVAWYAHRMWTLWVLLLALPLVGFGVGCVALRRLRPDFGAILLGVATTAAGAILAVVILHMSAN